MPRAISWASWAFLREPLLDDAVLLEREALVFLVSEPAPELADETAWVCLAEEAGMAAGEGSVEMGFLGAMVVIGRVVVCAEGSASMVCLLFDLSSRLEHVKLQVALESGESRLHMIGTADLPSWCYTSLCREHLMLELQDMSRL